MFVDCSRRKMAWRLLSLQPPQILNVTGDMELLGKQCRIHCKTHITYIRGLVHFWETNIPAGSKRFWMQFLVRTSQENLYLLLSCRITKWMKILFSRKLPLSPAFFKLLCFSRWSRLAILISKDKCKCVYTRTTIQTLQIWRALEVCACGYWRG